MFVNNTNHYIVDGEMMSAKSMRQIVDEVLEVGPAAWHIGIQDVIRYLEQDGRVVKTIIQ